MPIIAMHVIQQTIISSPMQSICEHRWKCSTSTTHYPTSPFPACACYRQSLHSTPLHRYCIIPYPPSLSSNHTLRQKGPHSPYNRQHRANHNQKPIQNPLPHTNLLPKNLQIKYQRQYHTNRKAKSATHERHDAVKGREYYRYYHKKYCDEDAD